MIGSRRNLLKSMTGTAGMLVAAPWVSALAQVPQPMPSPNAPTNQNVPAGMNGPDIIKPPKADINPLNQEQIAASVEQLYKLAGELKDEVEHTNLNATFSLDFIKKTQKIEKLAKQIRERAKG